MSVARHTLSCSGDWHWTPQADETTPTEAAHEALDSGRPADAPGSLPVLPGKPAWGRCRFSVDALPENGSATLRFESLPGQGELWLNDQSLGAVERAGVPCSFEATAAVVEGANTLAFRADAIDEAWIGSVDLELLPEQRIDSLRVSPDLRRQRMEVHIAAEIPGRLHLRVEGTDLRYESDTPAGVHEMELPGVDAWSPESPAVHTLQAELLQDDGTLDRVEVPFGLCDFTVKERKFHLNLRPHFLKGARYAPTPLDELDADLAAVKAARFDALRLNRPDRAVLDRTDRLGLLVCCDWPAEATAEDAAAIHAYYAGHVSLAAWVVDNDTTATALREAGCGVLIFVGTEEAARFSRPRRDDTEPYVALQAYYDAPVRADEEAYLRRMGDDAALCVVDRFSAERLEGIDREDDERVRALADIHESAGLDTTFATLADWDKALRMQQCETARFHIDALRCNARAAGYFYDRWRGGAALGMGPVTDAHAAPMPKVLEALQRPMRPVIHMHPPTLRVREDARVTLTLLNEARVDSRADLSLQIVGPTGQVLWKKRRGIKLPKHGRELWSGEVSASGSTGRHKFVAKVQSGTDTLAESVLEFYVLAEPRSAQADIHVVDPREAWFDRCKPWAKLENLLAPIHIVPPLANTIFAYPDNELSQTMAQVRGGAVALVFDPPADWNDWAERGRDDIPTIHPVPLGNPDSVDASYVKSHPVFEKLPNRCLLRQPYKSIAPYYGFDDESDEDICGTALVTADGVRHLRHLRVVRHGAGRIVFVSLRVMQALDTDAIAQQVFVQLIEHFARRSVPARQPLALDQNQVEWHRKTRQAELWRWSTIGPFVGDHDHAYPPEEAIEHDASYPGLYRVIAWRDWYTEARHDHSLYFGGALNPPFPWGASPSLATAYAATEVNAARRGNMRITAGFNGALKLWINGKLIFDSNEQEEPPVILFKQGRNSILVKSTTSQPAWSVELGFESAESLPIQLTLQR